MVVRRNYGRHILDDVEPVPALNQTTNETMMALGLREDEYESVQVRARYLVNTWFEKLDLGGGLRMEGRIKRYLVPVVENTVWSGTYLVPNRIIYFASDSHEISRYTPTLNTPVHRSMLSSSSLRIYLLWVGVSHGVGSFGAFGPGLKGNRCRVVHRNYRVRVVECPNSYTNGTCLSTVEWQEGKTLFGSVNIDYRHRFVVMWIRSLMLLVVRNEVYGK